MVRPVTALAIDLGTSNTLVHVHGRGTVIDVPSLVAVRTGGERRGEVMATGRAALALDGRERPDLAIVRPLQDGVVADLDACVRMLQALLRQVRRRLFERVHRVLISVPHGVTAVERAAFHDAAARATRARRVSLIDEPMAAAIGAGLPVGAARGHMVVDVGSGITEAAVTSLGAIVACASVRAGGKTIDERIAAHLRASRGLAIGARTAERLKRELLAADGTEPVAVAKGRQVATGLPAVARVRATELRAAVEPVVESLIAPVFDVLDGLTPELVADIGDGGIWITGGGSLVPMIAAAIARRVGVRTHSPAAPLCTVIDGNAAVLAAR
jgi:rod shape-determining protein MreB and related proteins